MQKKATTDLSGELNHQPAITNQTSGKSNLSPIQTKQSKLPPIQTKQSSLSPIQTKQSKLPPIQAKQSNLSQSSQVLPTQLKQNMENMGGVNLDDVKVYANSPKPAQLQAEAYAQGSEIYLAKGKDQHLAHEAWHVVQQKQGRVQSTTQTSNGVQINDQPTLEKEADEMGNKALQLKTAKTVQTKGHQQVKQPIQRKVVQKKDDPELKRLRREVQNVLSLYLLYLDQIQSRNWDDYSWSIDVFEAAVKASSGETMEKILVNNMGSEMVEMIKFKGLGIGEFVEIGINIQKDLQNSQNITAETDVRLQALNYLMIDRDAQEQANALLITALERGVENIKDDKEKLERYAENLSLTCKKMRLMKSKRRVDKDKIVTKLLSQYLQSSGHYIYQDCVVKSGLAGCSLKKDQVLRTYLIEPTNFLEDTWTYITGNRFEDEAITQALIKHAKWPKNRAVPESFIRSLLPNISISYPSDFDIPAGVF